MPPLRLVVATTNTGKVRELAHLLTATGVDLVDLSSFPGYPEVAEDADTYAGNALIKARAAATHTGMACLADDSGLEVDALDGAPGIRSARFATDAGRASGDSENITLLLERLAGLPAAQRTARFRCAIAVVAADGRELVAEGACEGVITDRAAGANGFGYDPVFYHGASEATFAQLPAEEKQRLSHRAAACRELAPRLRDFLNGPVPLPGGVD